MKKLIEGLKYFQDHLHWERQELFERSTQGQKPQALLITCSDSRVLPETLLQADPGDLFVSRNAGNLVPSPDATSGEAASIEYAVSALGVKDIIVCGHYRCGAVRAVLHPGESLNLFKTHQWLAQSASTPDELRKAYPDLEGEELWDRAVEHNVLAQLENLKRHASVAAGIAAGDLRLHAWVLRFESSEILAFDASKGAFVQLENAMGQTSVRDAVTTSCRGDAATSDDLSRPPSNARFESLKCDLGASLVVFAVALPLCVAIAKSCNVPAATGVIAAAIGGVVLGWLGGGAMQVSGPTASLIVVLLGIAEQRGFAGLAAVTMLAGAIQMVAGALRLGQWFRAVSPAVILGMLAGIGINLFAQQFHICLDDKPAATPVASLISAPLAIWQVFQGHPGHSEHIPAAILGLLTLAVMLIWKPLAPGGLKKLPAVLIAVVAATAAAAWLELPVQRVQFDNVLEGVRPINLLNLNDVLGDVIVWQAAFTVAFIASAESLLTAAAVDRMHRSHRTAYDRELVAQGFANTLCGAIGVLPIAAVIVRSSANIEAGARTRRSAVFHGLWMLMFAILLPVALQSIPTAVLAATLVLTGLRLVQVRSIRRVWTESAAEGAICIMVAASVVVVGLPTGVLFGVALSLIKLVHAFSHLGIHSTHNFAQGRTTMILEGSATFLRLPKLASALDAIPPGADVQVDVKRMSYIDHACMTLLTSWREQHRAAGGNLTLDWEALLSRFRNVRPRPM